MIARQVKVGGRFIYSDLDFNFLVVGGFSESVVPSSRSGGGGPIPKDPNGTDARPDIGEFGEPTELWRAGEIPDMD